MVPIITGRYPESPETHSGGLYPIDEFFVTKTLTIHACGYLEDGTNKSDHQPIWIELDKQEILGTTSPDLHKMSICRLQMKDPRVVSKYNTLLEYELQKRQIYYRALKLFNEFKDTLMEAQQKEYDLTEIEFMQ